MKRTFKKRIAFVLSLVMLLTGMNLFVAAAGIVAGDINGDKKVNTKDLTRLMRYIATVDENGEGDEAVEVVAEALDTNGDKDVNTMDLTHLMKYIAGDNVVLYPIEQDDPTDPPVVTYEVTFKDFDGTVLKTQTVNAGESATPPADPTREGYTFAGWDGSYTNVSSDSVVTATYTQIPSDTYTVTFYDYDGTTVLATRTGIAAGGFAEPPANPTKSGATFLGWSGNYSNVSSDEVVVAVYSDQANVFVMESDTGSVGDTVTVKLSLKGVVSLCRYSLVLTYDSSLLELTDYDNELSVYSPTVNPEKDEDSGLLINTEDIKGTVKLEWASSTNKTKSGALIELEFKIVDNSQPETVLGVSSSGVTKMVGTEQVAADASFINGMISIN